jgi:hypothetical protein
MELEVLGVQPASTTAKPKKKSFLESLRSGEFVSVKGEVKMKSTNSAAIAAQLRHANAMNASRVQLAATVAVGQNVRQSSANIRNNAVDIANRTMELMRAAADSQNKTTINATQTLLNQQATFHRQLIDIENENRLREADYQKLQLDAQQRLNANITALRNQLQGANEEQKALLNQQINALQAGFEQQNQNALNQLAAAKRTNELLRGVAVRFDEAAAAATATAAARAAAAAEPRDIEIYECNGCYGSVCLRDCPATRERIYRNSSYITKTELGVLMGDPRFNNGVLRSDGAGGYSLAGKNKNAIDALVASYRRQIST